MVRCQACGRRQRGLQVWKVPVASLAAAGLQTRLPLLEAVRLNLYDPGSFSGSLTATAPQFWGSSMRRPAYGLTSISTKKVRSASSSCDFGIIRNSPFFRPFYCQELPDQGRASIYLFDTDARS